MKQTTTKPRKSKKALTVNSSSKSDEDIGNRPIQQGAQDALITRGRKAWKPKVENLNMQIIND